MEIQAGFGIGIVIGIFIGAFLGVLVMSLAVSMSKNNVGQEKEDPYEHKTI